MKPYPLASLNHLTFPLAIARCLQRSESILHFVVLGTPIGVRRLYRNTLNFCQEIATRVSGVFRARGVISHRDFLAPARESELGSPGAERELDRADARGICPSQRSRRRGNVGGVPRGTSDAWRRRGEGAARETPP